MKLQSHIQLSNRTMINNNLVNFLLIKKHERKIFDSNERFWSQGQHWPNSILCSHWTLTIWNIDYVLTHAPIDFNLYLTQSIFFTGLAIIDSKGVEHNMLIRSSCVSINVMKHWRPNVKWHHVCMMYTMHFRYSAQWFVSLQTLNTQCIYNLHSYYLCVCVDFIIYRHVGQCFWAHPEKESHSYTFFFWIQFCVIIDWTLRICYKL